jgi:hypothetical protein
MWLIRGFLWTLVASVCYQGYQRPPTSTAWIDFDLGFGQTIPRAFVVEAIKETQKHPRLLEIPKIQARLVEIQKTLDYVRKADLAWRLEFQDLITSLQVKQPWKTAVDRLEYLKKKEVKVSCWLPTQACREVIRKAGNLQTQIRFAAKNPWLSLMRFEAVKASAFIRSQYLMSPRLSQEVHGLYKAFEGLYNVTAEDSRVPSLTKTIDRLSWSFKSRSKLIKTLMLGDLWAACMSHAIQHDTRIHSLLDRSGIIEVQQIRERIYNLSVSGHAANDLSVIAPWFDEAATWSWWLPDTIPAIVRRCLTQKTGDCKRIGSTEIDSLMSQSDMSKSIHVGLWAGVPIVLCIFAGELLTEYFKKSPPMVISLTGPGLSPSNALIPA